jgi:hypothetical protein
MERFSRHSSVLAWAAKTFLFDITDKQATLRSLRENQMNRLHHQLQRKFKELPIFT